MPRQVTPAPDVPQGIGPSDLPNVGRGWDGPTSAHRAGCRRVDDVHGVSAP